MSKKRELIEAKVIRSKNDMWNVSVEGVKLGQASNLLKATALLWDHGYKSHAFRRGATKSGKPMFYANVLKFEKKDEE